MERLFPRVYDIASGFYLPLFRATSTEVFIVDPELRHHKENGCMCLIWKKRLLTLVECGGAVYVSRDEGGLRLLPHSVVPHPPDAALGREKRSH